MQNLLYNISQILGITIIHSLWQGLFIYIFLRLVFLCMPSLTSAKKHFLAMVGLLATAVWFGYTIFTEALTDDWIRTTGGYTLISVKGFTKTHFNFVDDYKTSLYRYLPYISSLYIIGFIINILRLRFALTKIGQIKSNLVDAAQLQPTVVRFSRQLNIVKSVQIKFSAIVNVPCVIGYIKPIILLPLTITTQLSSVEIEAILVHELSHIKNNDYLINIIQQVVNALLFFNPFAQLLSRMVSSERENRCDDIVVQFTGNALIYAHALLKVEETRQTNLKLALAATNKKHHLLIRLERIMKTNRPVNSIKHILLAISIFTGSVIGIAWLNPATSRSVKNSDPELVRLKKEVELQTASVNKFYNRSEYTKWNNQAIALIVEIQEMNNKTPEIKKLLDRQKMLNEQLEKIKPESGTHKKLQAQYDSVNSQLDIAIHNHLTKDQIARQHYIGGQMKRLENEPKFSKQRQLFDAANDKLNTYVTSHKTMAK